MKLPSVRAVSVGCSLGVLTVAVACGSKSAPAALSTPTAPSAPTVAASLAAPAATSTAPTGGVQLTAATLTLEVTNAVSTGTVGTPLKYRFEISEKDTFPDDAKFTLSKEDIEQGSGTTSWPVTVSLQSKFLYFWRARAYTATVIGEWSKTESFKTANLARCDFAKPDIFDPLTDGSSSCANGGNIGGNFIPGQGWKANSTYAGLNFDISTCSDCTVEFDVTNFGNGEGSSAQKDVKWLSMGDRNSFGDFTAFRNHPWKMHIEQRSDGNGTGMKLIWRNGDSGARDPGDHTAKVDPSVNSWKGKVWHFVFKWQPSRFSIKIGEVQTDGTAPNLREWFQDGFARPYEPGNHRITLGCYPRDETMQDAIWRNVKIYRN